MTAFVDGAALLLGVLLLTAGAMKLARPRAFEHAVHRLLPGRREWETTASVLAPAVVGGLELLVGAGLAGGAWWPTGLRDASLVAGTVLYLGFVGVIVVAIRKGEACGCWSSFSDGRAGGSELARACLLAAVATVAAALGLATGAGARHGFPATAAAWAAGLAVVTAAAALAGAGLQVGQPPDPAVPVLPGPAGRRLGRQGAFLLGRVTSTKAALALPRVTRLSAAESGRWVERVQETRTAEVLGAWLAERGRALDWSAVRVKRMSVRTPQGRVRQILLEPDLGAGSELTIALSLRAGGPKEPVVVGSVDGARLLVAGGEVTLHAPSGRPATIARPGRPPVTAGTESATPPLPPAPA